MGLLELLGLGSAKKELKVFFYPVANNKVKNGSIGKKDLTIPLQETGNITIGRSSDHAIHFQELTPISYVSRLQGILHYSNNSLTYQNKSSNNTTIYLPSGVNTTDRGHQLKKDESTPIENNSFLVIMDPKNPVGIAIKLVWG